jgi:hypothetical protein
MFLVEYQNGKMITEQETTWHDLKDNVPLKMVLLCNNGIIVGLAGQDEYWFSNQAVAQAGHSGTLVAQIVGGRKGESITEFIQSTETGKAGMFHEDKFQIRTDHKRGV